MSKYVAHFVSQNLPSCIPVQSEDESCIISLSRRRSQAVHSASYSCRFMDTLGDISGSESEAEDEQPAEKSEPAKKRKVQAADPAPEELQALGLRGGPSILAVPEPQENGNPNWEW